MKSLEFIPREVETKNNTIKFFSELFLFLYGESPQFNEEIGKRMEDALGSVVSFGFKVSVANLFLT